MGAELRSSGTCDSRGNGSGRQSGRRQAQAALPRLWCTAVLRYKLQLWQWQATTELRPHQCRMHGGPVTVVDPVPAKIAADLCRSTVRQLGDCVALEMPAEWSRTQ